MGMDAVQRLFLVFLLSSGLVSAHVNNVTEEAVLEHIFGQHEYNKDIRYHNSTVTNVTVGMSVISLDDVDIVGGKMSLHVWLNLMWKDERLAWDPSQYGGLPKVIVDKDKIWMPDMSLYNHIPGESEEETGPALLSRYVLVSFDGTATFIPSHSYTIRCNFDTGKAARYSNRTCEMKFGSWVHDGFQIDTLVSAWSDPLSEINPNNIWEVLSVKGRREVKRYSCCPEPYPSVIFTMSFRLRMDRHLGTEVSNERRLYHYLLDDYIPDVFPVPKAKRNASYDVNDPMVPVDMWIGILRVTEVDFKAHTVVLTFIMMKNWLDEELSWDPAHFGGIKKTSIPIESIWRPSILVANRADDIYDMNNIAHVESNGRVRWAMSNTMRVFCKLDAYRFPFDSHKCYLWLLSYRDNAAKINMNLKGAWGGGDSQFLQGSLEWDISEVTSTNENWEPRPDNEVLPGAQVIITVTRKYTYYNHIFTAPCVLLAFLTPVVFLLPTNAPEKVTLGIGIFVSLTLLLEILEDNMFAAEDVPIIALYYVATMVLTSFSIVMSSIILNVWEKGKKGRFLPKILRVIFLNVLGRILRVTSATQRDREMVSFNELENRGDDVDGSDMKDGPSHMTHGPGVTNEWFTLAAVIDRLLFLTFLVVAIVCSIAMFASG